MTLPALGKVVYVDDDAPAGGDGSSWAKAYRFLQDGLAAAGAGDEIRVAQGVYKPDRSEAKPQGTGDRNATFEVSEITLAGGYAGLLAADPNVRDVNAFETILSGDLLGNDVLVPDPCDMGYEITRKDNCYHVVTFLDQAVLEGVAVSGGQAVNADEGVPGGGPSWPDSRTLETSGGGLFIVGAGAVLRDCVVKDNYGSYGGGLLVAVSALRTIVDRCVLTGNAAYWQGGAICILVEANIRTCRISDNYARGSGGGCAIYGYSAQLADCAVANNTAQDNGGGIYFGGATAQLIRCLISSNSAAGKGGGAYCLFGVLEAADSDFCANEAFSGGAIAGLGRFSRCRISCNRATYGGGAYNAPDWAGSFPVQSFQSCIFSGNTALKKGGAVFTAYARDELANCTAVGNWASEGDFLADDESPSQRGGHLTRRGQIDIRNCIIGGQGRAIWNTEARISIAYTNMPYRLVGVHDPLGRIIWGQGLTDVDPCLAVPGYWDPNGTPADMNDDFFVEGDYHIKSQAGRWDPVVRAWVQDDVTSLCIDAGDPNSPIGLEPFPNGGRINMGAYGGTAEASKSWFGGPVCQTIIAGDINGDCRIDFKDLLILVSHWLEQGDLAPTGTSHAEAY